MSKAQHELEQAVLACMISSPRVAPKVAAVLDMWDFTESQHRMIFDTMQLMVEEGKRIDELTLTAELRDHGYGESVYDRAVELYSVAASLASVTNAEEYAAAVREESIRRKLSAGADAALNVKGGVEEVVATLEGVVFDARSRLTSTEGLKELSGASILNPLDCLLAAPQQSAGYPYPFPSMRAEYGSYERERLTYIGGYSGDGKTTLALQWLEDLCEAGAKVCMYQLEMSPLQVNRALVVQGGGLTQRQVKRLDAISAEDEARYKDRKAQIARWDLTVRCGPTLPQLIRAAQARERHDIVIVDHIHKFERTSAGEYNDVSKYSSQLHRISRDLDCSVICLVQFRQPGRDMSGKVKRGEPSIADMRGTGSMEQDADDVLLVYQDRDLNDRRRGLGGLIIGKMRDGKPDQKVPLKFSPDLVKFHEYDPHHTTGPSVLARRSEAI